ncbi:MAG TPA: glycoside hydrolase family 88 protein, partial [Verrucomicrobiae bacterium]|nr:glycoside hydrolase family 88 protein [Verrucomicrobiae bacterium]
MKLITKTLSLSFPNIFLGALAALLLFNSGCATGTADSAGAPSASGGITDAEIRDVVHRVARHQIRPLKDGEYTSVTATNALQLAQAAAAPAGIGWSYPWGVTLYGMLRSADVTGDTGTEKFVLEHNLICARYYHWLADLKQQLGNSPELAAFEKKAKIGGLLRLGNLDSCGSMGNEILAGMMRHPDQATPEEKQVVERIANWVVSQQDRLPDGTLWRSKSMGGTLWPDDLYMGGVFLARWGQYTGDQKYIDDAARQIINQAALEEDADGLWFHGYFVGEKKHAPFKWGRGNGWVTVALVEALSAMPEKDPLRPKLIKILSAQIEGLKKVQAPDGMWRQVLDKPELWEETSCTAMFAYGIARAVNRGWIDAANMEVARKAF